MNNTVFIVPCQNYESLPEKLDELLEMMGGMDQFVRPGDQIVLKVNLLRQARPEEAVCTHPAVVAAVATAAKNAGATPLIADSPGGGFRYSKNMLQKIYAETGMLQAAEQAGVEVNLDVSSRPVSFREGILTKHFDIITPVIEANAVFNLCKLKTHLFTGMTGAVKNIFGVIPGLSKPGYHAKLQNVEQFAGMLLDLAQYISPRLTIMDAVTAMEGDGPGTGDPKQVGLLLASQNMLALDVVASEIIGLDRSQNPLLREAERRGLEPNKLDDVEIIGVDRADLKIMNFKLTQPTTDAQGYDRMPWYQQLMQPLFKDAFTVRPRVIWDRCIACGACIEGCPMEAVHFVKEKAFIDNDNCIRCYCCHEMCPEEAIELHRSWLYQLIKPS